MMSYWILFQDTLAELKEHKLRTLLTLLGMIFGVGAVIAMLNIGEGAEREALKMIDSMGVNNVIVNAKEFDEKELREQRKLSLGLTLRDGEVITNALPFVKGFAATKNIETYTVFSQYSKANSKALGVSANYFALSNSKLSKGAFFTEQDNDAMAQVVILGDNAAQQLFPLGDAVGNTIKINHNWFLVVGVLANRFMDKSEFQGVKIANDENQIFMPFKTAFNKYPAKALAPEVDGLMLQLNGEVEQTLAAKAIEQLLSKRHSQKDDYELVVPAALLAQQKQTQRIFNIVMSCVAGISLLVGGIGIMNIMLATVLERTKEIGLLRAVGATQKDIQLQFLNESFVISILGGVLGVVFGIVLSELIALYSDWSVSWSGFAIMLSFSICALIGLVFGVYPAVKASQLDPIEALQTD